MGSMVPTPLATGLGEKEMLLAKDVNTHFIDRDGEAIGRKQIPWRSAPQAIGYSYPYLLALEDINKGILEVRNPQTLTLLQSIDLPGANLLQVPNPNISLAHQGKGFLVASERIVWRMKGLHYNAQIDALVEQGSLDEAISLLDMLEETLINHKRERLREIRMQKAMVLFNQGKFRLALDLFNEVSAPPERVIRLYPEAIAGELSTETELHSPKNSQQKKRTGSMLSTASAQSVRKREPDDPSINSSPYMGELPGKELKSAVRELQAFLADLRRRLQRFFNHDQALRTTSELFQGTQAEDNQKVIEYVLGATTMDDVSTQQKLCDVAKLVDTTLFRAHMYATPSLVGPLVRLNNYCDPDVVMDKLEENKRYNDLIDFLHGKGLHRQALERLQKFGQAKTTEEEDPHLHGPDRTVSYLQNMPPHLTDLILEFAKWPMESNPEMGMEVFMADTENAESLPREKVLEFLQGIDTTYALRYLEHVVENLHDLSPELHQQLVMLYLERLKDHAEGSEKEFLVSKFLAHLRGSTQYSPAKILALLPRDKPTFLEATAIVLQKMGQHRQALQIYVFKLDDTAKAEEYCNQVYLQESVDVDQLGGSKLRDRKKQSSAGLAADPTDEKSSVYSILLGLYLQPPPDQDARVGDAIDLMARHGPRLPASSTLNIIPANLLVKELEFYLRGRMRNANTAMSNAKIQASLRKVDHVGVQAKLLLGESRTDGKGGQQRRVKIDDERVCGVCHKRLGGSVISVFPDNSVVHLGCASRRGKEFAIQQK